MRYTFAFLPTLLALILSWTPISAQNTGSVRIWEEPLTLPAYLVQPPNKNPMFYVPANYQGAQRVIYPYAQNDGITAQKAERTYRAVYLENEYVRLCVVPELGGRLFYATDKGNDYHFIYKQNVIKPSNIGMTGAWISGGIEWCVFHHHRASTFLPVDYQLAENPDGSKTVWVGEFEPRHRMKWSIGISLLPGRSYIDVQVKMFNRTAQANSILFWANVATHANDQYRTLFPPSVDYAVFHAKNSFVRWPISGEAYAGHDYYKNPTDLSWWKNHPEPTSFFAFDLEEGFIGGYDYGKQSGTVAVGNPNIVAGVKLWEWGPGPAGQAWDKVLTDSDGPYAELMVGAFSDNQPDYSWIKPYEAKIANIKWYPMRELRGLKRANENAAMNLELSADKTKALIGFNTTQKVSGAKAVLMAKGQVIYEKTLDIDPTKPLFAEVPLPQGTKETDLWGSLSDAKGNVLITYQPVEKTVSAELPPTVEPPLRPEEIENNELCYLTGLRILQFHNASIDPNPYFLEVLKRDPDDIRCNTMIGLDKKRRGLYEEAAGHFRRAIRRITRDYTRPRDCEALYHLGLVLKAQGKPDAAYDTLYRATWDYAWHSPAYFHLAEISSQRKDYATALEQVNFSLSTNAQNTVALDLKSAILRKLGRYDEAMAAARQALDVDPLDFLARNELYLVKKAMNQPAEAEKELAALTIQMRDEVQNYLETAISLIHFGLSDEALELLERAVQSANKRLSSYPEIHYCLGYLHEGKGDKTRAAGYYQSASKASTDYCFPFRLEMRDVLEAALRHNPQDSRAHYYLGNLLYDLQPETAIRHWEKAVEIDPGFALSQRNLGFGYFRNRNNIPEAIAAYEKAIRNHNADPTYYIEIDQLYEMNNTPPATRLATMERNVPVLAASNDLYSRYLNVLVLNDRLDLAIRNLSDYSFSAMEGNEWIHEINVNAHLLKGNQLMRAGKKKEALAQYLAAAEYPANQRIGKSQEYERDAEINYYIGLGYEAAGNAKKAREHYTLSVQQKTGNNQNLYFKGLAHQKLGHAEAAAECFDQLIKTGEANLKKANESDFFAKFGETGQQAANLANAYYLMGLGHYGRNDKDRAKEELAKALTIKADHVWAREFLDH